MERFADDVGRGVRYGETPSQHGDVFRALLDLSRGIRILEEGFEDQWAVETLEGVFKLLVEFSETLAGGRGA